MPYGSSSNTRRGRAKSGSAGGSISPDGGTRIMRSLSLDRQVRFHGPTRPVGVKGLSERHRSARLYAAGWRGAGRCLLLVGQISRRKGKKSGPTNVVKILEGKGLATLIAICRVISLAEFGFRTMAPAGNNPGQNNPARGPNANPGRQRETGAHWLWKFSDLPVMPRYRCPRCRA